MITVANKRDETTGEYIGRPSPLGNPWRMHGEDSRTSVVANYRTWLGKRVKAGNNPQCQELNRLWKIWRSTGKLTLVCWCAPKLCHGDVIKAFLETTAKEQT